MKSLLFVLLVLFVSFDCWADKESHARAKRYGATATFRLTVVDDQGEPVPNAKGSAGFWNHRTHKTDSFASTSNEKGEITLSGKCFYDGAFGLKKEGYYTATGRHIFSNASEVDVEETLFTRKWVPDYVSTVVLKRKHNPIPMYARSWRTSIPVYERPIGLDLKVADWVKPYGRGESSDVYITIHLGEQMALGRVRTTATKVTFDFPNRHDGLQVCKIDKGSAFLSSYHANLTHPFQQQLVLKIGQTREDWLPLDEYLVFRIRSKSSPTGELLQCHYGKIYPFIDITKEEIAFKAIYFNPTPNDTNLEFAPEHNLSSKETLEDELRGNIQWP